MQDRAETPEAMEEMGRAAAAEARAGTVIALIGGLGAGKTHWTKGFVAGLGCDSAVTSPTFGLVHEYRGGGLAVFHWDFYRIDSAGELVALGWDEYLDADGVTVVEWGDKFPELLPDGAIRLVFSIEADGCRVVSRQ